MQLRITFHVGLHKTATTWLQSIFFKQHPNICLLNDYEKPWSDEIIQYLVRNDRFSFSPEKFRHMVQDRIKSCAISDAEIYLISAERLSGHPLSGGYDREKIIQNIYSAYPDSKILVTVRNQVDLIRSTYQQLVKEGDTRKITEFLNSDCWKKPCFNLDYYDFAKLHTLYNSYFEGDNLAFFFFEDLVENKTGFINDICAHLGTEFFIPTESDRVNESIKGGKLEAIRILNHFRKSEYNHSPIINLGNGLLYKTIVNIIALFILRKNDNLTPKDISRIHHYYSKKNHLFISKAASNRTNDPRYFL